MAGLIPLMLASSSRTSCTGPSQPTYCRRQSTPVVSSSPTQAHAPRPKPPKRLSLPTPVATPELPCTHADWKRTISQVKRQYFSKRYRACTARCLEILEGIKDSPDVDPVYLIYLHFYAATSQEMCGRSLPFNSPLRTSLLQQARTHFDRAASLISAAEESVAKRVRSCSAISSRASSCHSPSSSISSRAWTPDTVASSPTNSILSFEDLPTPKSPQSFQPSSKRAKKVSFSLPPQKPPFHFEIPEPLIRPDSPTLGFDDSYFQAGLARRELPELPTVQSPPKFREVELPLPLQPIPEFDTLPSSSVDEPTDHESAYQAARSADRACEHLADLRTQVLRYVANLDELLLSSSLSGLSLTPSSSKPQPPPARRANGKTATSSSPPSPRYAAAHTRSRSNPEQGSRAAADRQARIERLRSSGWQRKRFDAKRYEELRETVMAELG